MQIFGFKVGKEYSVENEYTKKYVKALLGGKVLASKCLKYLN